MHKFAFLTGYEAHSISGMLESSIAGPLQRGHPCMADPENFPAGKVSRLNLPILIRLCQVRTVDTMSDVLRHRQSRAMAGNCPCLRGPMGCSSSWVSCLIAICDVHHECRHATQD